MSTPVVTVNTEVTKGVSLELLKSRNDKINDLTKRNSDLEKALLEVSEARKAQAETINVYRSMARLVDLLDRIVE